MRPVLWLAGLIPAVLGLAAFMSSATSSAWQHWHDGNPLHPVVAAELRSYQDKTLDAATAAQLCPESPSWTLVTAFPLVYRGRCVFVSGRMQPEDRSQPFMHLSLTTSASAEDQQGQIVLLDLESVKDRAKFWENIDVNQTISAIGTLQGIRDEYPVISWSDLFTYPIAQPPSPTATIVPIPTSTPTNRFPSPSPHPSVSAPQPATTVAHPPATTAVATCVARVSVQPASTDITGGDQFIWVQALTDNGIPVAGAAGELHVAFGGGQKDIALLPTGKDGMAYAQFNVDAMPGDVEVTATLNTGNHCSAAGVTSFKVVKVPQRGTSPSAAAAILPSATAKSSPAMPSATGVSLTVTPTAFPSPPTATASPLPATSTPSPTPLARKMVSVPVGVAPVALEVDWNPAYAGGRGGGLAYVVNQGSDSVSVVNWSQGLVIATIPVGNHPSAIIRDQNIYVLNQGSDTVSIIDQNTWKPVGTLKVGHLPVAMREVLGPKLYVVNEGSSDVTYIDETTRQTLATIPVGSAPSSVDGDISQYLYVSNTGSGTVSLLSQGLGRVIATLPVGKSPVAMSSDRYGGHLLVVNRDSNTVSVIDPSLARTRPVLAVELTLPVGNAPIDIAEAAQNSLAYVANSGSNTLTVIDTQHFKVVSTLRLNHSPNALYPDSSGLRVFVTYRDSNTITVIDTSMMRGSDTPRQSELGPLAGHPVALVTAADRLFVVTRNPDAVTMIDLGSIP